MTKVLFMRAKPTISQPMRRGETDWCGLIALENRTLLSSDGSALLSAAAVAVDLGITQVNTTLQDVIVPGDRAQVRGVLTNLGTSEIKGILPVVVELADDEGGRVMVATWEAKVSLKAGKATTIKIPLTVTTQWPASQGTLHVRFDGAAVADENDSNDSSVDARPYEVRYEFGNVAGREGRAKLVVAQGEQVVTFSLTGNDGFGAVEIDGDGRAVVELTGTTWQSGVRIATTGGDRIARLAEVAIAGDLKSFDGKTAELLGDFDVSGILGNLKLRSIASGHIHIEGAAFANQRATLTLGNVQEVALNSSMAIASLTASSWLDADDDDVIAAPSIGSISIAEDFEASLELTDSIIKQSLGSLTVRSTAREMQLRSAGSIGTIKVARLIDSAIFSGMDVAGLPIVADDFARATMIRTVEVTGLRADPTGSAVVNGFIAASHIGSVKLARIEAADGSEPHGIAADTIGKLTGTFAATGDDFSFSKLDEQAAFDLASAAAAVDWAGFEISLLELPQFDAPVAFDVVATAQTTPVPSSGDAADDIAVWVNPADASQSLVLGTNKAGGRNGGLFLYDLAGNVVSTAGAGQSMNNIDLRYGFSHQGQLVDVAAVTNRTMQSIDLFVIDAVSRELVEAGSIALDSPVVENFGEAYGLTMHHDRNADRYYVFASDKSGRIAQFELLSEGGQIVGERVRYWKEQSVVEGMVIDDLTGALYVGEETKGIYKYEAVLPVMISSAIAAPPPSDRQLVDNMAGPLDADVEGLAIYRASADQAYLLASSQGSNRYIIYDAATFRRLAVMRIVPTPDGLMGGTSDTDGIEAVAGDFGSGFSLGLFIVQDGSNPGGQNFKLVSWADMMEQALANGLTLEGSGAAEL